MLYTLLLIFIYFFLYRFGFWGFRLTKYVNPFYIFYFIKFNIFMFPGVVYVYLVGGTYLNNGLYSVSPETVADVLLVYTCVLLIVPIVLLSMNKLIFKIHFKNITIKANEFPLSFLYASVLLQMVLVLLQILMLGENFPLYQLLTGDFALANETKKMLLTSEVKSVNNITLLGYWAKYIFYFVPLLSLFYYNVLTGFKFRYIFYISTFLSVFFFLTEGHKAAPFLFLLTLWLFSIYLKGFRLSFRSILISIFLVFSLFYLYVVSFGYQNALNYALQKFMERLFIGQSIGFYYILEYINPDIKYLSSMLPLASIFFQNTHRAVEDIVQIVYGYGTNTVNMNTFFLAEAYSLFGYYGIIIFTIYFCIFIYFMMLFLMRLSRKSPVFFLPLTFTIFAHMPINQSLTYFLMPKELISISICFFLLFVFYRQLIN